VPKIAVVAKITAKPDTFDELVAATEWMVSQTESEPGTEVYAVNVTGPEEGAIWFYEVYTNDDAYKAHGSSEAMAEFAGKLKDLVEPNIQLNMLTLQSAKGWPT
jgi:quinol monooxygenase YgiN